jgi:hypothetical protein
MCSETKLINPFNIIPLLSINTNREIFTVTNMMRAALNRSHIPEDIINQLDEILNILLADELSEEASDQIELSLIAHARFDKLLRDVIDKNQEQANTTYDRLLAKAWTLQQKWQKRFKADYFAIDNKRLLNLNKHGALRGVILDTGNGTDQIQWKVHTRSPIADADLVPGQ